MPKKETLQEFTENLGRYPAIVLQDTLTMWNQETLAAMGKAIFYAPKDKGTLHNSARAVKAVKTITGIASAFIFAVPYAHGLEIGKDKRTGKKLNIKTTVNPNAQSGYSSRAVKETEPFFMSGLKKIISKAFDRI